MNVDKHVSVDPSRNCAICRTGSTLQLFSENYNLSKLNQVL